jgi:acetyl/propionyl-CoA carboxylase alpha subunit
MPTMRTVLIANRGEIACRIAAACRLRGLTSVAVYSEADRDALHVRCADRAVAIGPAEPAKSYLNVERLMEAARQVGADALHPGYGFLAERASLAEACEAAGIAFIGPRAESIRTMGDKRAARDVARRAGVPVVPGAELAGDDVAAARGAARELGYPVLVKAALGGGGKGMSVVARDDALADALESARRVAAAAFGDASVYLEKYVPDARHVEIQILGDGRGRAIHLFERECSLQRRHQKILEETPSVALDSRLREKMCAAAVAFAEEARYLSAGTCEFLLAANGEFYFLEMNTRIQVEHPVTEMTTGVDLVAAQLALATDGALPLAQSDVTQHGTAVEVRLYAEDPAQGFLPQAGRLLHFEIPAAPFVRVDAGVETGSPVSVFYDPMLAKIIAWGASRAEAYDRLASVLDDTVLHGLRTNLPLLRLLARDADVREGRVSTGFLERDLLPRYDAALRAESEDVSPLLLAAAAVCDAIAPGAANGRPAASPAAARGDWVSPFARLGAWRVKGLA